MNRGEGAEEAPFRLKPGPLLVAVGLSIAVVFGGGALSMLSARVLHTATPQQSLVDWVFVQHTFMLLLGLLAIAILKFWVAPADYGLHWPRGRTYIGPALLISAAFGVLMWLVDYAPQLLAHNFAHAGWPPGYPLHGDSVWRWLAFEVYVGPTEEIPTRALLVTYLAATMPGKIHLGRFTMNWAGIIVAVIFALLHATSFFVVSWPLALGQQIYAFAIAVLYAYWFEKSQSIVAPMLGHSVSDCVEFLLVLACLHAS